MCTCGWVHVGDTVTAAWKEFDRHVREDPPHVIRNRAEPRDSSVPMKRRRRIRRKGVLDPPGSGSA
jgi:hypothetical protein